MIGAVIYDTNAARALEAAQVLGGSTGMPHSIFQRDEASREVMASAGSIAVSWNLRRSFFWDLMALSEGRKLFFYNDSDLIDIDDIKVLEDLRRSALAEKNYELCKGINELMLFGDVLRRRSRLSAYPSKLQLETTNRCNARCIMCSHAYETGRGADILETGIVERLQGVLPYVRTMILHGNGEPFLKKDIVDYLRGLQSCGIKFVTNTNLSVLTDETIELMRTGFEEVNISCDGHTRELYESIRAGLDFDNFCSNVRRLRKECPELTLKMAVVVMKQNLPFLGDIADFAADLGFDEVDFNQLCVDERNGNLDCAPYLYRQEYREALKKARETALGRKIAFSMPDIPAEEEAGANSSSAEENQEAASVDGICDWLIASPYIQLTGEVGICCINQNCSMGSLAESSFEEIWNCEKYRTLREMFYSGKVPDVCRGCDFLLQRRLEFADFRADIRDVLDKRVRT